VLANIFAKQTNKGSIMDKKAYVFEVIATVCNGAATAPLHKLVKPAL